MTLRYLTLVWYRSLVEVSLKRWLVVRFILVIYSSIQFVYRLSVTFRYSTTYLASRKQPRSPIRACMWRHLSISSIRIVHYRGKSWTLRYSCSVVCDGWSGGTNVRNLMSVKKECVSMICPEGKWRVSMTRERPLPVSFKYQSCKINQSEGLLFTRVLNPVARNRE